MRPRRRSGPLDDLLSFGGRVPPAVGGLIAVLVLLSIFGRLGGIAAFGVFQPAAVLSGQVWRLVTWPFFEGDPLGLLFGGLMLYWFGRDLCWAWGEKRFVATFFAIAAGSAIVTTLLAFVLPIEGHVYAGAWAVLSALTIAWAMLYPDRQILLMFAIPIAGSTLLWITVGGTVLYALFYGFTGFIPHLAAQALMAAYLRGGLSARGMFQSLKIRSLERKARRRASHLKVVDRDGEGTGGRGRWMN